ncbi:hypothetical protein AYO45_05260 [Gammaproteobacteria bacterium SCGC AG-212-F23]|nr:hypothetical protein AYO45_05260 [Gammaproteobacteria bacterium SCGC AG-212-F23]
MNKKIQELNASKPLLPFTLASIEIQQQKNTEVMRLINQRLELSITEMAAILIHFKIPHTEANNLQYSPDFMDALFNEQTEVALGKEIIKIFNDLLDLGFKTRLMHVHHQFLLDKINRDTYQQIGQWLLDTNVIQLRTNTSAELANTLSASIHSTLSPELLTSLVKKVEKATNRFTTQKGGTKQTPASLSALEKNIRNQIKNNFNMELTSLDDEREGQYHRELIHDLFGFFTAPIPENGLPLAIIQHTHKNYAVYDNVGLVSRNTKNSTITLPAYLIDFLWSNPDQKQPIIIHAPSLMYLQAKTLDAIAQQHHPEEKSPYKNLYESYSTLRQQFQATGKQTGQDSQHQLIFAKTAWGLYKVGLSSKKYILSTIRQAILLNANTFIGNKLVESSLPLAQLIEDKFPACSAVTIKDDHKQATGTTVANTNTSSSLTVVCYANNKREFSRLLTFFKSLSYPIEIDNTFYVITIRNANNLHKDYKRSNESTTSTITSLISRFGMRKSSDMSTQASTISTTANKDEKFSPEIFQKTIALIIGENKQTFKIILELIDPKRGEYSKALLTACAYLNKATKDADYNTTVFLIDYMTNPKSRPPTLEINKKSKTHGWAAIHYAAQGHHRAYEILETNGADINLREDKAPYRIAAEMLAQHPAPTTTTTAPVKKFG